MINKYIIAFSMWNEYYDKIEQLLKSFIDYKQIFTNVYIIKTHQRSKYVFKKFKQIIGNDSILVIDYDSIIGILETSTWDWLKHNNYE